MHLRIEIKFRTSRELENDLEVFYRVRSGDLSVLCMC